MSEPQDYYWNGDLLATLVERLDPAALPVGSWSLTGGVSAQVDAVAFQRPGESVSHVVVRRHHRVAQDFRLLTFLTNVPACNVPVPIPLLLDTSCTLVPEPYMVMTYVEGNGPVGRGKLAKPSAPCSTALPA
jgi:hypothetical protein